MSVLVIYAKPAATLLTLRLDSGHVSQASSTTANGRDDAHVLSYPDGSPIQGAALTVEGDGLVPLTVRGILTPSGLYFDDFGQVPAAAVTPNPIEPIPPGTTPEEIIEAVYYAGSFDLSTHDGCGQFTEAACDALHESNPKWGHIRKNPGQNQYNSHAVDAVMLLAGPSCGIYDIILDSVSPNAAPAYNYKGVPQPELWYYPA